MARDDKAQRKTAGRAAAESPINRAEGRVEAYRALAQRIAAGEALLPPVMLTGQARRRHIRETLREDHAQRIVDRASGTEKKFDLLAGSLFDFFRGTALLFYRDMVGEDADMPSVLVLGDVHPGNFGVMPNADNVPIFGVNDFDETTYAPFTWDMRRGALGFLVAAREIGGHGRKTRRRILCRFVDGYLDAMQAYADHATEKSDEFRFDNSPKVLRRLFEETWEKRESWLWEDYLDHTGRGFRSSDKLTPVTSRRAEFQALVDRLVKQNGIDAPERSPEMAVKDVAVRHGQGTASLGLPRYYVLIEGPSRDASDDLIIEFKRARPSALAGLVPPSDFAAGDEAKRISHGQSVQLAHGDIFFGAVEIDGQSFLTRERAPFRGDIDLGDLSTSDWKRYARACGRALARAHALSDDLGQIDYDVEPSIVAAATPRKLFKDGIVARAEEALDRLERDHAIFRQDHALGAFNSVDMVYR